LGDPLSVLHIGLVARHALDVLSVAEHQAETTFKQIEDRLPEDARGFHRDMRDAFFGEPIRHRQNLACRGTELP
jgi:hypothetical protein